MDQQPLEVNFALYGNEKAIEAGLKSLWEKTKRAAEMITALREERVALQARVEKLEGEVLRLKQELQKKDETLKTSHRAGPDAQQATMFSNSERQVLTARVRELLAKLEAYL